MESSQSPSTSMSLLDSYTKLFTEPAYRPVLEKIAAKRVRRCRSAYAPDPSSLPSKRSFIDVPSTGMRLAYLEYLPKSRREGAEGAAEWAARGGDVGGGSADGTRHAGQTSNRVVLLLHDVGLSSAVWHDVATELAETGAYTVIALDIRGHGRSTWSAQYTLDLLARDVHGFIVEKNLYSRPICVIGLGMGGLVGMMLAAMGGKKLVGAVGMIETGVVLDSTDVDGDGDDAVGQPWVGGGADAGLVRMGVFQYGSVMSVAGWLASPMSGIGPRLVRMAETLVQDERDGRDMDAPVSAGEALDTNQTEEMKRKESFKREFEMVLEYETGDQAQCVRLARSLVRDDGRGGSTARADPAFALKFSQEEIRNTLKSLDMHVLFMFGQYSAMSSRQDVCRVSSLCASAASVTVEELPEQSSRFVRDDPDETTDALLDYIQYTAMGCFDVPKGDMWARTPANLGLRPLDEYESLEAAKKALGARKVPTRADIEEALRQLRVEEGREADDVSEDEGDEHGSGSATALCHDNKNYFGFIG